MKKILFFALVSVGSASFASELEMQAPVYNGSGCEPGSIQLFLGSDRDTIHFGTPDYRSAEGERKTCMIVLPVRPAAGTKVAISAVRVNTESALPEDATGVFQAELFIAGLKTPAMNLLLEGPLQQQDFTVLMPDEDQLVWSGCGQSANLRVNSNLIVTEGSVQVVSLRVRLKISPC